MGNKIPDTDPPPETGLYCYRCDPFVTPKTILLVFEGVVTNPRCYSLFTFHNIAETLGAHLLRQTNACWWSTSDLHYADYATLYDLYPCINPRGNVYSGTYDLNVYRNETDIHIQIYVSGYLGIETLFEYWGATQPGQCMGGQYPNQSSGVGIGGTCTIFEMAPLDDNDAWILANKYGFNPPRLAKSLPQKAVDTGKYESMPHALAEEKTMVLASWLDKTNILIKYRPAELVRE